MNKSSQDIKWPARISVLCETAIVVQKCCLLHQAGRRLEELV